MAVPTGNIRLSQVAQEIFGNTNNTSLNQCFAAATGTFNSSYVGNKDRLSNFRGYIHAANNTRITVGSSFNSYQNACSSSSANTYQWHNGDAPTPFAGDKVWANQAHTQNIVDGYYKIYNNNPTYVIYVVSGEVQVEYLCS